LIKTRWRDRKYTTKSYINYFFKTNIHTIIFLTILLILATGFLWFILKDSIEEPIRAWLLFLSFEILFVVLTVSSLITEFNFTFTHTQNFQDQKEYLLKKLNKRFPELRWHVGAQINARREFAEVVGTDNEGNEIFVMRKGEEYTTTIEKIFEVIIPKEISIDHDLMSELDSFLNNGVYLGHRCYNFRKAVEKYGYTKRNSYED
jgi:hypothetical protein